MGHFRSLLTILVLGFLTGLPPAAAADPEPGAATSGTTSPNAAAPDASTPGAARALMAKWVETQQVIAKETRDWQQGKEILQSRIALVKSEIASLEEKLEALKHAGSDAGRKQAELEAEDRALRSSSEALGGWIGDLEARLRGLSGRLPDPLQAKLAPLFGRMPADPKNTKVSLAERCQNVVGILNEAGKFNNDITMVTEVRTLSDGKPTEVRVIYLGLAQAYFVSAGGEAGVGRPAESGWTWETVHDLAPRVLQAVEVLQSKSSPKFVPLPVTIQ
jgi:FtsZ-binding cell division protein ZapB